MLKPRSGKIVQIYKGKFATNTIQLTTCNCKSSFRTIDTNINFRLCKGKGS